MHCCARRAIIICFQRRMLFRSVGWRQDELFHLLVAKTFGSGFSKDNVAEMTVMACTGGAEQRISLL